jgi:hypothetical protein
MRIALCLSGQPRYLDEGFEQIDKNILSKYSVDVFIHTWWDDKMVNQKMILSEKLSYNRNYIWKEDTIDIIKKYYSPIYFQYEPQIQFNPYLKVNYELCTPESVHSMFYSLQQSNEFKKNYELNNNFKYDAAIRCRFDISINKFEIDFYDLDLSLIGCYVLNHEFPNDQFAISSSNNMDVYSNVFSNLERYYQSGWTGFTGERLLKYHLEQNKLKFNHQIQKNIDINIIKK